MDAPLILRLDTGAAAPETSRPDPSRVIAGDPVFTTWGVEERDGMFAGVWRSTPEVWRVVYDEWEYCVLREGVSVVTPEGGDPLTLRAGDSIVIRPGFRGTWEVVETTVKGYVIRV